MESDTDWSGRVQPCPEFLTFATHLADTISQARVALQSPLEVIDLELGDAYFEEAVADLRARVGVLMQPVLEEGEPLTPALRAQVRATALQWLAAQPGGRVP